MNLILTSWFSTYFKWTLVIFYQKTELMEDQTKYGGSNKIGILQKLGITQN